MKAPLVQFITTMLLCSFVLQNVNADENEYWDLGFTRPESRPQELRLWLTISAQQRFLEVSWKNAPAKAEDTILLTSSAPGSFQKVEVVTGTPLAGYNTLEDSVVLPLGGYTSSTSSSVISTQTEANGSFSEWGESTTATTPARPSHYWSSSNGPNDIVVAVTPTISSQWFTTGVPFDYTLSREVTSNTSCYGYWASYINGNGQILASTCVRAYPRWMHDMHSVVSGMRLRDLFIPGTHDSGSYRPNFHPFKRETIVTKYALTQDDDIRGQLMHGVRYLDIRVGYYRNTPELFFINHGITRQRPFDEVIQQVKDFVLETNEIVIFGLKEFPVGFGKNLSVHRLLVQYLLQKFGDLIVHPSVTWSGSLREIWQRHHNIILAYDKSAVVFEFPHVLFSAVEQRWGNVKTWAKLESYLKRISSYDLSRLSSRPIADMAELTPDTWDVLLDKYGGLRKMADNVNWRISQLYRDELGERANIVAADFIRGTTLMETAIDLNKRKVIY